jgi:hypothetical protein
VILSAAAGNGGLVFGYVDKDNYWLLLANKDADDYELWQVSSGTFTERRNGGRVGAGTHSLSVEVRSGSIEQLPGNMSAYNATVPAGKVGLWAGSGTASAKFDDFKLLDMAALVDVDDGALIRARRPAHALAGWSPDSHARTAADSSGHSPPLCSESRASRRSRAALVASRSNRCSGKPAA